MGKDGGNWGTTNVAYVAEPVIEPPPRVSIMRRIGRRARWLAMEFLGWQGSAVVVTFLGLVAVVIGIGIANRDASPVVQRKVHDWTADDGAQYEDRYFDGTNALARRRVTDSSGIRSDYSYELRGDKSVPVNLMIGIKDGEIFRAAAAGPLSDSGSRHGEWEFYDRRSSIVTTDKRWYWYGDEISEGEWHLRNK